MTHYFRVLFGLCLVFVGVFFLFSPTSAATTVSGTLPGSATWTKVGSPYLVNQVEVPVGATLTIEPGVVVKLAGTWGLYAFGTINIGGNGDPVIITTIKDDSFGGDTNNDGAATTPSKVDYCSIGVHTNATIHIKNTQIYYGGCTPIYAQVNNLNGTLTIEDSVLSKSGQFGLLAASSGTTTLRNTEVKENVIGVRYHKGTLVMEGNSIHDNLEYGMTNTSLAHTVVDAHNTWWGDVTGPLHVTSNPNGLGNRVSDYIFYTPWKDCFDNCVSNVLFLPGIMGTRLYEYTSGGEEELWVSSSDARQEQMVMNSDGTSKNDIYTKDDTQRGSEDNETGLVDDAYGSNLYESFLEDLRDWKTEGVYTDYAFIPYDWRLSLEDIVMNGRVDAYGNLRYTQENGDLSQSYLYQKSKALQASSKSGKVTLIGHSNGGLVIKAFVQKLKDAGDPLYFAIDKIILVGVPQTGTPDSVVSMLYGSKIGIAWLGVSAERSRSLIHDMPTMYNLLPSEKLFESINPPIEFVGNNIDPSWTTRYGDKINTYAELQDFLLGAEGRSRPDYTDTLAPEVLNSSLLGQAEGVHQTLDNFTPAPETEVVQIAGWGMYTIAGLQVTDEKQCIFDSNQLIGGRPVCTENKDGVTIEDKFSLNGDATVLVPSALDIPESSKVKKYWVDLGRYNTRAFVQRLIPDTKHKDVLEMNSLRPFIKSLINGSDTNTSFDYISSFEPEPIDDPYIKYEIHSPLHLTATDTNGHVTGWDDATDTIVENIKGAQYFEIGDIKTVLIPKDTSHTVRLTAYEQGSFTFNVEELQGEAVLSETKFEAIPTLEGTVVDITPSTGEMPLEMKLDFDADGEVETVLDAVPGEVAEYENPTPLDTTPPETTLTLAGEQGVHSWYRGNVTATLGSEEGAVTEYALDDGEWQVYTLPVSIDREGVTVLRYRSRDMAGNQETAKEQEVKIDTKSPEAFVRFDIVTEKIVVEGTEDDIEVTTSGLRYFLTDQAGNTTVLTLAKSKEKRARSERVLQSIQYGDDSTITLRDTQLKYFYKEERKREEARAFTSSLRSEGQRLVAHYVRKKDQTYIMDKTESEDDDPETSEKRKVKTILPGLVVPYIETENGKVNIKY